MSDDQSSTLRKVYFFRIEHFSDLKDLLLGAFQRIENLPFNDDGRYFVEGRGGARLCVFPDSLDYPIRLRFGRTRRDQLPDVEKHGKLEALDIAEDAGLIDFGHLLIFDDGHIAAEWNPDGPKLQRLSAYLFAKGGLGTSVTIRNLFERDIVEVVSRLSSVRILDIELPVTAAELAREADADLASAIIATERMGATKKIGLSLTADQGSSKLRDLALRLARLIQSRPHERQRFNTVRATGSDGAHRASRYVDLLEDKLVTSEMFPRRNARSRSIDSDEAYRLIQRSYAEIKPRLAEAATSGDL